MADKIAIYPGSFDPITYGHIDIIKRAAVLFDEVIVAVARNLNKAPLFTVEERMQMIRHSIADLTHIRVDSFEGLLVEYAAANEASAVIRGLRAVSDFEYELQMALMNRRLSSSIETVFMLPAEAYSYLSSKLVKEIAQLGGSIHGLVPEDVEKRLSDKFRVK